jgi:hypothetical protein
MLPTAREAQHTDKKRRRAYRLHVFKVASAPVFEATRYVWGSRPLKSCISKDSRGDGVAEPRAVRVSPKVSAYPALWEHA